MRATEIASALLEDGGIGFDKQAATLQYRPYQTQDAWKWFWVLLPDDNSRALATGTADSRAQASTMARLKARKLGIVIQKVDLMKPN
jgi:hypothetical protein